MHYVRAVNWTPSSTQLFYLFTQRRMPTVIYQLFFYGCVRLLIFVLHLSIGSRRAPTVNYSFSYRRIPIHWPILLDVFNQSIGSRPATTVNYSFSYRRLTSSYLFIHLPRRRGYINFIIYLSLNDRKKHLEATGTIDS